MRRKFSAEPAQFLEKQSDLIIKSDKSWVAKVSDFIQRLKLSQLYLDRFLQIFTIHVMCILNHMAKLESMDAPSSDNSSFTRISAES